MGLAEIIIPRCVISGSLMSRGPLVQQRVTVSAYMSNIRHEEWLFKSRHAPLKDI